ncbi:MAG: hypothetical protein ACKOWW_08360 [Flavobacteriales bacterium]
MKHLFFITLGLFIHFQSSAQVSFGGGLSLTNFMNNGSSPQKLTMPGLHAHVEIPRSGDVTFYGRVNYLLPKANSLTTTSYVTAISPNTNPYILAVNSQLKTSYFLFEGGNRYYLGNDYDNGFAGYGGSGLLLGIGKVKKTYDELDVSGVYSWETLYQTDPAEIREGKIFAIGGYLQGGVKYTIPATGTIYADLSTYYLLLANGSNSTASQTEFISPFFFNFTIGFKKDLY